MDLSNKRVKRNDAVAWRVIEAESLLVDPKTALIYPLNEVASRIWESLDGETTCTGIVEIIDREFEGDKKAVTAEVSGFIEELLSRNLAYLV